MVPMGSIAIGKKKSFPNFLTSLIMARLFLGLSFSGLPGIFLGALFLFLV